ncbi:hypothetical protein PUMCH_005186 [Australozyma saopauloensis]|uniref:Protein RER1 n=1 Tax=Australozyma saopauloensis TaxID=291208 RepID=A0AAX4HH58_9ASCO|nr:hypothetical protein PUMCH_005186 [[Candida] saopauloensis]
MDLYDNPAFQTVQKLRVTAQKLLDASVPHTRARWAGFGVVLALFLLRIILVQGWYIICYALAIYLLNLFLAFLTPKFDPSLEQEESAMDLEDGVGGTLPTTADEEFRPFIRRLPEFKFWRNGTVASVLSLVMSFFSVFDIPVFWPILVVYFVLLFALTMRKQIQHMVKYKYLPWDIGKAKYNRP